MKPEDYRAMLQAIESALAICRDSLGKSDEDHLKIYEDLKDARDRLLKLV